MFSCNPAKASVPIIATTPDNPNATPNSRIMLNRSSDKKTPATKMVNKGVVAFKIDAKPDEIVTCALTIKQNGTALLIAPMMAKLAQTRHPNTTDRPVATTKIHNATAATDTRTATKVMVGISRKMIALKKNDPPQIKDRKINIAQSIGAMRIVRIPT